MKRPAFGVGVLRRSMHGYAGRCIVAAVLLAAAGLVLSASPAVPAAEPAPERLDHRQSRAVVRRLLVPSPYRIPATARQGRIRYRLSLEDGRPWIWPDTGEQHVRQESGDVVVTICTDCGQEVAPPPAEIERYRRPNRWVDADSPGIVRFARRHAAGGGIEARMKRLVQAVRRHMDGPIDFRFYDTASAALRKRSGDCTEYAVLLAATARAVGIPARVAYGVAYSGRFSGVSHVFSPHAWVQAWDGARWISYDAGLGKFDAGHIALFVGDGNPIELDAVVDAIDRLRIVSAVAVKTPLEAAGR